MCSTIPDTESALVFASEMWWLTNEPVVPWSLLIGAMGPWSNGPRLHTFLPNSVSSDLALVARERPW